VARILPGDLFDASPIVFNLTLKEIVIERCAMTMSMQLHVNATFGEFPGFRGSYVMYHTMLQQFVVVDAEMCCELSGPRVLLFCSQFLLRGEIANLFQYRFARVVCRQIHLHVLTNKIFGYQRARAPSPE